MKKTVAFAVVCMLATVCQAAEIITPPKTISDTVRVPVYSIVKVSVEEGETVFVLADKLTLVETIQWAEIGVIKGVAFTAPPGVYLVVNIPQGGVPKFTNVTIGDPEPDPDPGPGPDPDPTPDVPNAEGYGAMVYKMSKDIGDPSNAKTMGNIYLSGAASLAALSGDILEDTNQVFSDMGAAFDLSITTNKNSWKNVRTWVANRFRTQWTAGKNSRQDVVNALDEIGTALNKAAGE